MADFQHREARLGLQQSGREGEGKTAGADRSTRVFISYSRTDKEFAARLRSSLEDGGYEAYIDTEDIAGSEEWKKRIESLILAADAIVFVVSPASVSSPVCDWETKRTLEAGKRLIPIVWKQLPAETPAPDQISDRNYIYFDEPESYASSLSQLRAAIDVDISWVREHTRLVEVASRWKAGGTKVDALLRGEELSDAERWLSQRPTRAPTAPEVLVSMLDASRRAEVRALQAERARLRRMRGLQLGVGVLVAVAALVVLAGAAGVARLTSREGAQRSITLARFAANSYASAEFDRAARFALAGLQDANAPFIGYNADAAEFELQRAIAASSAFAVLRGHTAAVNSAHYSHDGARIVTASDDGTMRIWNATDGAQLLVLSGHDGAVRTASFSEDGNRIVSGSYDNSVRIWDAHTGRQLAVLRGHVGGVAVAAFSPDGRRIVSASADSVRLWDAETGALLARLAGDNSTSARFSADGRQILSAGTGGVGVWDARTFRQTAWLRPQVAAQAFEGDGATPLPELIDDASFSPDGRYVVAAAFDGIAHVWEVSSGRDIARLEQSGQAREAVFSDDGRFVLVSGDVVRLWSARRWRVVSWLGATPGADPHFSRGGQRMVLTRGADVTLFDQAYEVFVSIPNATWLDEIPLAGHEGAVNSVEFSPDDSKVVTASSDGTARIWNSPTELVSEEGMRLHAHNLSPPDRAFLRRLACSTTLANGLSRFSQVELNGAPILDPVLDADPCAQQNIWLRLRTSLGLTPERRT